MTTSARVADLVTEFKTNGRIVIVGASMAGLRAAEALRDEGFNGKPTIIAAIKAGRTGADAVDKVQAAVK